METFHANGLRAGGDPDQIDALVAERRDTLASKASIAELRRGRRPLSGSDGGGAPLDDG